MYCGVSGCSAGWMHRIHPCGVSECSAGWMYRIRPCTVVLVDVQLGGCIEYIHVLWC